MAEVHPMGRVLIEAVIALGPHCPFVLVQGQCSITKPQAYRMLDMDLVLFITWHSMAN